MINPNDFLDSYQLMRIQMMLCPTGFLTHCSNYKLKKKIVLFLQLYNHLLILNSLANFQSIMQIVFQLNCIYFGPYSAVYRFIQVTPKSEIKLKQKHNSYFMNTQFSNQKEIYSNIKQFDLLQSVFLTIKL